MTSTTETETKVETQAPNKEEALPASDNVEAVKEQPADANSAPASPTKKTGTLKNVVTVHKKDFETDIVYLYQFVRTPTLPSLSACCLKVETWLRLNGVQYENIDHKLRYKSKKGQLPFIELNGKEVEEADNIIRQLSTHFNKNLDEGLTEEQSTVSHAFSSMLDNHTGWIVRWWRYNNPQEFIDTAQLDIKRSFNSRFPNSILNFVFKIGFRKHLKDAVGYGLGRFTLEEITELAKNDLTALSKLLGNKDYFFGKEQPTLLDITAFAHLAQFIYVPFAGIKEWLEAETPNLIGLVDRLKGKVWSDWDEIVSSLEMNTHLPKKETPAVETVNAEEAKKAAEEKKAEKKRLAEEKKKEREEKKKKEKEEKERKKKEKEEAEKAAKEKAAAEEAAKKAEAEAAKAAAAPAADTPAATETKEADKQETAPNGAEAAKPAEVVASE